jgi:anti-sigma factor RsiW
MQDDDLSALLRQHASRHPADERLRAAVRTQIALQGAAAEPQRRPGWAPRWAGLRRWLQHLHPGAAAAAGLALGVTLTLLALLGGPPFTAATGLPDELVASHVRALQVGPLFEVASSDRHRVKPWFQGRIDYAPPVIDHELREQGFALLGGRVQALQGRATAVLAYEVRLHKIDLFVWPAERGAAPERLQRRGFNLVHWSDGAMQFWAVSDVDAAELERFGAAWRTAAAAR